MKNLKYTLFTAALSVAMTASFSSCSDSFLDEKNKSSYTTDYFKTSQGIQDLATALYGNIRWHFGYEWAYGITLYGTDEFTNGSDLTAEPWNTYDSRLNPLDCTKANGAANNNCIIRKTKCFDFWERNVLFPKTKRSFFRTPTPLPCPFPLNFSLLIITKKFGNLAKNRYICIV